MSHAPQLLRRNPNPIQYFGPFVLAELELKCSDVVKMEKELLSSTHASEMFQQARYTGTFGELGLGRYLERFS